MSWNNNYFPNSNYEFINDCELLFEERDGLSYIFHDHTNNLLYVMWVGRQTVDSIVATGNQMVYWLEIRYLTKVLNDNLLVTGDWLTSNEEFILSTWWEKIMNAGLKRFAWVFSPEERSKNACLRSIFPLPGKKIVKSFPNCSKASEWLKNL